VRRVDQTRQSPFALDGQDDLRMDLELSEAMGASCTTDGSPALRRPGPGASVEDPAAAVRRHLLPARLCPPPTRTPTPQPREAVVEMINSICSDVVESHVLALSLVRRRALPHRHRLASPTASSASGPLASARPDPVADRAGI
jgi:hypothetical protein